MHSFQKKIKLYESFEDPTEEYYKDPRAFVYDLCLDLIREAKKKDPNQWYSSEKTIQAIILIEYCWNFASPITKTLDNETIKELLIDTEADLKVLESASIQNLTDHEIEYIKRVYSKFKLIFGQTGATKALSLLNPKLFVMWDTEIRKSFRKNIIIGIGNGETSDNYIKFLKGIQ